MDPLCHDDPCPSNICFFFEDTKAGKVGSRGIKRDCILHTKKLCIVTPPFAGYLFDVHLIYITA